MGFFNLAIKKVNNEFVLVNNNKPIFIAQGEIEVKSKSKSFLEYLLKDFERCAEISVKEDNTIDFNGKFCAYAIYSDQKYLIKDCKEKHGLLTDNVWYEAFDGLDPMTETYIRNMRANGEQINKNPRIKMSTIHAAKGGEADNVLLLQDLTGAALETFSHDPDELHRLFYTGATRAKRELHVLDPKNFDRAYIL